MRPATAISLLLLLLAGARASLPLPDYVSPCNIMLSDRKFSQCCVEKATEMLPKVMKGDPKYGIPVLDPLHLDRLEVINGQGPLGMQLQASDLHIHGIPKMAVNSITHITKPKYLDTYVITIPDVLVNAKYNISGRILLLPIVGQGDVVMTFKNLTLTYQFAAEIEKREDGEFYYVPQPGARLDAQVEGMAVQLDNLFNGDKTLGERATGSSASKTPTSQTKQQMFSLETSYSGMCTQCRQQIGRALDCSTELRDSAGLATPLTIIIIIYYFAKNTIFLLPPTPLPMNVFKQMRSQKREEY